MVPPITRKGKTMNKTSRIIATAVATATLAIGTFAQEGPDPRLEPNPEAKLHRFSTTVEKERPKLNKETQDLIAAYRRDPSESNREALRRQVAANYDAVVARKKAKLEELKAIVDEMLRDREQRIEASMARFTDPHFRPESRGEDRDPPPEFRDESPDAPSHARGRRGDRNGRPDLGDRHGRRGPPPEGFRHKPLRPEMDEDGADAEDPRPRPPRKGHGKRRTPRPDDGEDDGDRP